MCYYYNVSWRDSPWWVKLNSACQLTAFIISFAFWSTILFRVYVVQEPLPEVITQVVTAVLTPAKIMVESAIDRFESLAKELQQKHQTFKREELDRQTLLQAHEHCLAQEHPNDPEFKTSCRELFFHLTANISVPVVDSQFSVDTSKRMK